MSGSDEGAFMRPYPYVVDNRESPLQPQTRERVLAAGGRPCPKCVEGWLQYLINRDVNSCPKCGYEESPKSGWVR